MNDTYELYAIKYGSVVNRPMSENFIGGDPHDMSQNLDYFIWVATNSERTFVIDTGFNHEVADLRGRKIDRLPREGLDLLGIDAGKVEDVIITQLQYDHAGTFTDFKNARLYLQDSEMAMATGRCMCHAPLRMPYHVEDVCEMVRKVYAEQVDFHDGDAEIAPGISVHLCAGHAAGMQSVRVKTRRGYVMVASDATHFYMNFRDKKPFPILVNMADMLESWGKLRRLGQSIDHIIPGHDPAVLDLYPAADPKLEGIVARLDAAPNASIA